MTVEQAIGYGLVGVSVLAVWKLLDLAAAGVKLLRRGDDAGADEAKTLPKDCLLISEDDARALLTCGGILAQVGGELVYFHKNFQKIVAAPYVAVGKAWDRNFYLVAGEQTAQKLRQDSPWRECSRVR